MPKVYANYGDIDMNLRILKSDILKGAYSDTDNIQLFWIPDGISSLSINSLHDLIVQCQDIVQFYKDNGYDPITGKVRIDE